jgi:hypothetical protein
MQQERTMKATKWRRFRTMAARPTMPIAALAGAAIALAHCAAMPAENSAQPAPPLDYGSLVADALKKFKNFSDYSNFAISELRWVHADTGWSWLTCVRYVDRGRQRFYSFFITGNSLVNSRYDVRTDQCPAQHYLPFDPASGTVGSPTQLIQQPIY